MLKEVIDKLTSIYNEYGDIDVYNNEGCFSLKAEHITVETWKTPDNGIEYVVEL